MKKSTKVRMIIFEILIEIYKKNKNFDDLFNIAINKHKFNDLEKSFIFNVCLNTMRYSVHSRKILNGIVKKKLKNSQYILLASAITQIIFLNTKPYAVVNETVEIARKIGLFPSFINAVLKKVSKEIKNLNNLKITKEDLPLWFKEEINKNKNLDLSVFLNSYFFESSLHIVFKSSKLLDKFNENYKLSSNRSVFTNSRKKVSELSNYNDGYWWVQNFSSMLPIMLSPTLKGKSILDLCAAPGGKSFQIMSENNNITLNDVSKKRIRILKENLSRLKFSAKIENYNALRFPDNKKYDLIILDAPCSSVGTIRANPEILFKNKGPNLKSLFELQQKLLLKSSSLLKPKGIIIYMVCSFFFSETIMPVKKFLEENNNFSILKYNYLPQELKIKSFLNKDGYFLTAPTIYKDYKIDGFFSVQLIKNV